MNERTFLRVSAHVLSQRSGLGKVLLANLALERSMSGMTLQMPANLLLACEPGFSVPLAALPETVVMRLSASDVGLGHVFRQRVAAREGHAAGVPTADVRVGSGAIVFGTGSRRTGDWGGVCEDVRRRGAGSLGCRCKGRQAQVILQEMGGENTEGAVCTAIGSAGDGAGRRIDMAVCPETRKSVWERLGGRSGGSGGRQSQVL